MSSNLLIDEPPLQVLPTLAKLVGLNEAIVLQQIHYWLNPHHNKNIYNGYHWVFNSYEDWQTQFPFWSKDTIRRVIASLEKAEFICTDNFNKDRFKHRKWYRINYTKLQQLKSSPDRCVQNAHIEECKLHTSLFFRNNDPTTAQWVSKVLGEREQQEIQENLSYGAHAMRDGVSLNPTSKTTPLVLPTEIGSLQDLEAYLKLPGSCPITKLKMRYKNLKSTDAPFIETTSYYPHNRKFEVARVNDPMNQEI